MPAVEPLVMDFGLGQFSAIGEIEFWIANEDKAGYCGKYLYMNEGQTCPKHMHKEKLETFFIVKGRIRMQYDAESLILSAGDTLRVETGKYHEFTASRPTLILEVSKPSVIADNYFENPKIPIGGNFGG
jgi:N-acetylneuraminate synthase